MRVATQAGGLVDELLQVRLLLVLLMRLLLVLSVLLVLLVLQLLLLVLLVLPVLHLLSLLSLLSLLPPLLPLLPLLTDELSQEDPSMSEAERQKERTRADTVHNEIPAANSLSNLCC